MSSPQCRSLDPGAWSRCARDRFHDEDHWDGHPNGAHWSDDTAAVVDNREDDLDNATKARLWDELTSRIAVVRGRYEKKPTEFTFNSVYTNGVLAGLSVVESSFDHLKEFEIDKPHPITDDVSHLIDDRKR